MNLRMREKVDAGEAIDVSMRPRMRLDDGTGGSSGTVFVLDRFLEGLDYCVLDMSPACNDYWIWSIGRCQKTGAIYASHDTRFYGHPEYECLWLR